MQNRPGRSNYTAAPRYVVLEHPGMTARASSYILRSVRGPGEAIGIHSGQGASSHGWRGHFRAPLYIAFVSPRTKQTGGRENESTARWPGTSMRNMSEYTGGRFYNGQVA